MLRDLRTQFLPFMTAHSFLGMVLLMTAMVFFTDLEPPVMVLVALFCVMLSVVVYFLMAIATLQLASFILGSYVLFVGLLAQAFAFLDNDPETTVFNFPAEMWFRLHAGFLILIATLLAAILIVTLFSGGFGAADE